MKKNIILLLAITSATLTATGALPPKYLEIPGFKQCLEKEKMESWTRWCMPHQKPAACAENSWEQLNNLAGHDKPEACRN